MSDELAIKRVAAGPGEQVRSPSGYLTLAPDEAWLTRGRVGRGSTGAAGFGPPIDSNRFGPVPLDRARRARAVPLRAAPRSGSARISLGADWRLTLTIRSTQPLARGPPDPWAETDMPSRRDGPPFHMTEMIEAEPALAARLLERLAARRARRRGSPERCATAAAPGRPIS